MCVFFKLLKEKCRACTAQELPSPWCSVIPHLFFAALRPQWNYFPVKAIKLKNNYTYSIIYSTNLQHMLSV